MSATEIILIIIGFIAVVVGYVMPAHMGAGKIEEDAENAKKDLRDMVRSSVVRAKGEIRDQLEDTIEESLIKSERGMDRITNDKMNAISDYADTVLGDIHKNHDEVVFMYDMLNDKHKDLTGLVSDVSRSASEARQTVLDAELTAKESMETANTAMEQIRQAKAELEELLASVRASSGSGQRSAAAGSVSGFKRDTAVNTRQVSVFDTQTSVSSGERKTAFTEITGDIESGAAVHAENAKSGMMRLQDARFAPLSSPFEKVESDDIHRVMASTVPEEEDQFSAAVTDYTLGVLSSKVVPISNGAHDVRTKIDMEKSVNTVVGNSALAVAREVVEAPAEAVQDRQQRILEMYNMGKSNVVIARELGVGVGEVRLVIDLFSGKRRSRRV